MKKLISLIIVVLCLICSAVEGRELEGNWIIEVFGDQLGLMNINPTGGLAIVCEGKELSVLITPAGKISQDNSVVKVSYNNGSVLGGKVQTFSSKVINDDTPSLLIKDRPAKDFLVSIAQGINEKKRNMVIQYNGTKGMMKTKIDTTGFATSFPEFLSTCVSKFGLDR